MTPVALFDHMGIVVTGATGEVGSELVLEAARQGAFVVFSTPPDDAKVADQILAQAESEDIENRVTYVVADLASEEGVEAFFDQAESLLPGIHVLINNVTTDTFFERKELIATSLRDWNRVIDATLRTPFWLSRRAVEEFLVQGEAGRIIHVMLDVTNREAGRVGYASSQSGLRALIRSIAKEYGHRGINCNGIFYPESLLARSPSVASAAGVVRERPTESPAGRPGVIVEMALFLASSDAGYINGEVLSLTDCPRVGPVEP